MLGGRGKLLGLSDSPVASRVTGGANPQGNAQGHPPPRPPPGPPPPPPVHLTSPPGPGSGWRRGPDQGVPSAPAPGVEAGGTQGAALGRHRVLPGSAAAEVLRAPRFGDPPHLRLGPTAAGADAPRPGPALTHAAAAAPDARPGRLGIAPAHPEAANYKSQKAPGAGLSS